MSVADQGQVADIRAFVNFHGFTPSASQEGGSAQEEGKRVQAGPIMPAKPPMLTQPILPSQARSRRLPKHLAPYLSANLASSSCFTCARAHCRLCFLASVGLRMGSQTPFLYA